MSESDRTWRDVRLGEAANVIHGWPFKSDQYVLDRPSLPVVVAIGNFDYKGGFRFESSTVKQYIGEYPQQYELMPGSILLVMTCQTEGGEILGVPGRVPDDGRVYLHNQRLGRLNITRPDMLDDGFAYHLARSPAFNRQLFVTASGSKILHTSPTRIEDVTFSVPPVEEQRAIAEVLNALDDKIAANSKIAHTTENLLQCAYRGLILKAPVRKVRVRELVQRISQKRKFNKSDLLSQGDFPVFDQSESGFLGYLNGDGFLKASNKKPLIYFGDHTCKLRISTQPFAVGPNTVPFEGVNIPSLTLFCALKDVQKHEEYKRHWNLLLDKEISVPAATEAAEFAAGHEQLLMLNETVIRENQHLAATRDALLPQLMSGKLRVKETDALVTAAI